MAPPGNSLIGDVTADDLKGIPLPLSLPCKSCSRDKDPNSFAKKYHSAYRYRYSQSKKENNRFVPKISNTNYKCRKCTGEQVNELMCEGQCGLWKPLDQFSKSQRRNGEKWCKICVSWKISQEPGVEVVAAPGQDLAPDENEAIHGVVVEGMWDPEDAEDDEEFDEYSTAPGDGAWLPSNDSDIPISSMAGLQIHSTTAAPSSILSDYVPPHLRNFNTGSAVSNAPRSIAHYVDGSTTATPDQVDGYVPPHLRARQGAASMTAASSISNPYEGRRSVASSSTVGGHPIQFSGWDNSGQQHRQIRLPSETTSATSTPAPTTPSAPLDRPDTQKSRGNANWARPVGNKNVGGQYSAPKSQPPQSRQAPPRANRGYDSDGSVDEM